MLLMPATVTLGEARDVLRMLAQALVREPKEQVVVDASGLQQFDSSALAVLIECGRLAQASGRAFAVRGAPEKVSKLARLHGVDALLPPDERAPASAAPG